MAYRRRSTARRSTYRRAAPKRSYRSAAPRRTVRSRSTRSVLRQQSIKLVIETRPQSGVSRPDVSGMALVEKPSRKAKI